MAILETYLAGVLITGLVAGPVATGVVSVGNIAGAGAGVVALTWPVSLPALVGYGAMTGMSAALTPAEAAVADLLPASQAAEAVYLYCQRHAVLLDEIEAAGGHHAFSSGRFAAEKLDSPLLKMAERNEVESATNWRGNSTFRDIHGRAPGVTADWVGDDTNAAGAAVSNLRICTLTPTK